MLDQLSCRYPEAMGHAGPGHIQVVHANIVPQLRCGYGIGAGREAARGRCQASHRTECMYLGLFALRNVVEFRFAL